MQNPDVPRTTQHHATTDQTPENAQHMPPGHPRRAGHHDHPTMITGERGARKPARPVREETDAKDPTTAHLTGSQLHSEGARR